MYRDEMNQGIGLESTGRGLESIFIAHMTSDLSG